MEFAMLSLLWLTWRTRFIAAPFLWKSDFLNEQIKAHCKSLKEMLESFVLQGFQSGSSNLWFNLKENFQKDFSHQWHLKLSRWWAGTVERVGKAARVLRELDSIGYFRVIITHTSCIYTFLKITLWWLLEVSHVTWTICSEGKHRKLTQGLSMPDCRLLFSHWRNTLLFKFFLLILGTIQVLKKKECSQSVIIPLYSWTLPHFNMQISPL